MSVYAVATGVEAVCRDCCGTLIPCAKFSFLNGVLSLAESYSGYIL
jgi:hypothetical protein